MIVAVVIVVALALAAPLGISMYASLPTEAWAPDAQTLAREGSMRREKLYLSPCQTTAIQYRETVTPADIARSCDSIEPSRF